MSNSRSAHITASPAPDFARLFGGIGPFSSHLEAFGALHASGSSAIYWACRGLLLEPGTPIWMPALNCGVEVQAALDAGLDVGFYRICDDLSIDEADLSRKLQDRPGVVFVIHYFGFPQPSIERLAQECESLGCVLIEDCAHSLFSKHADRDLGSFAPLAAFSFRKTLPLADGGALTVNEDLLRRVRKTPFDDAPSRSMPLDTLLGYPKAAGRALAHRWLAGVVRRERRFASTANFEHARDYAAGMSPFSQRVAATADPVRIVEARRRNYLSLDRSLDGSLGYRRLFAQLDEGVCPLYLPVLVESREELMAELYRQGVETFRFGAIAHPILGTEARDGARRLRENILGLPIHDEVTPAEVEKIAEVLRPLLSRHALR